jgi:prevent-host-death family protein
MLQVAASDFKANLGKYLTLVAREDIHITRHGKDIAVLTAPESKHAWVEELVGIIPPTTLDAKQLKAERLAEDHEGPG